MGPCVGPMVSKFDFSNWNPNFSLQILHLSTEEITTENVFGKCGILAPHDQKWYNTMAIIRKYEILPAKEQFLGKEQRNHTGWPNPILCKGSIEPKLGILNWTPQCLRSRFWLQRKIYQDRVIIKIRLCLPHSFICLFIFRFYTVSCFLRYNGF